MFCAIKKIALTYPVSHSLSSYLNHHETFRLHFSKIMTISSRADKNIDKPHNPKEKTGDVMSHSFREGYASRSDEEGFGGIYDGNQTASKVQTDKFVYEDHPAYDKTQGCHVIKKEKARNQTSTES